MKSSLRHIIPILILLLIAAVLVSCRPKGILHSREMREIIVDLHKTDALLSKKGVSNRNVEARQIYYAQVLEKHHVTQAEFDSSLVWYTAHPQLFDKIYPKVLAELASEEESFLALHPELAPQEPTGINTDVEEAHIFNRTDLDSVIWVTSHGYSHSWEPWQRTYRVILEP